ncbi:hypothetical protein KOR34_42650 [Posidoniimonas corsicana]|uniref:Uncharacterized protein n=1 Tax=Posidoniimonas corsicana TaxID=1938618 RepID=A0A5C5V426_9BACT|nr:hypothetical protein [Posidoniimonas corsicana]TWT32502.1 hypothetical protein KOR34_42650 [Posidoniimonas corsicana]
MNLLDLLANLPLGAHNLLMLAQAEEEASTSYGVAFLLLVLCLVGGVMAAVKVDKRDSEIKR